MDHSALHIIEWLSEMGDDVPLTDSPIDRFAESELAKQNAQKNRTRQTEHSSAKASGGSLQDRVAAIKKASTARPQTKREVTIPDESVVRSAIELAQAANTLDALKQAVETFDGCNLKVNAKNTIFAKGNPNAKIMLIDEHPGKQEDEMGSPFAGRSEGLLEKMLSAIDINIDEVYQVAALPWHPPGSRSPTLPEINICKPFLERHITLAKPKLIFAMGNTPTRMLLGETKQALTSRGNWQKLDLADQTFEFLVTLNPAFLLKQPAQKRLAWQDLLLLKAKLAESD